MARFTVTEAVELFFEDQLGLIDSGDECEVEEDPAFPLPRDDDNLGDEREGELEEPLPQTSPTPMELELDLSTGGSIPASLGTQYSYQ